MAEEEETALLSATTLTQGYISKCEALGDQSELVETTLSLVGDERWHRPDVVAFQHGVQKSAQLVERNRSSGQRGAEEYGKPLYGPEKLSSPGVPDLVHTKGDGAQFMQLLASQQPLKQLEKMVPHGFRQSKLFEALVQHKVPMPRALWLVKIIYLNRVKHSSSDRLELWTEDVCQYIGELLKEGLYTHSFVSRGGEFHTTGEKQTGFVGRSRASIPEHVQPGNERNILETIREKWSYIVALARWSISASILDQEIFLTSMVEMVEKAATTFGDRRVSAVIGMLVPILSLLVPFATTSHRLTCRLASVCANILRQGGPFATAATSSTGTFLDNKLTAAIFDILQGLHASPDAFVVSKVELPSLDELSNRYPGVEISESFSSSVKYIKARVESLKKIETPSAISQRVLDIVSVLDRMMGATDPDSLIEKFVDPRACPAFSRENSSLDREDSLCALVHVICDWATRSSFAENASHSFLPSSLRLAVACKVLKKFQLVQKSESEGVDVTGRDRHASTTSRQSRDVVEMSIYSWILLIHRRDTQYNPRDFHQRSELVAALLETNVTSLERLTSQLIVDGTMEGARLEEARYLIVFYGAFLLRFTPAEHSCRTNPSLSHIRGTCIALLDNAHSVLRKKSDRKRKANDDAALIDSKSTNDALLRSPPSEREIDEEVDVLVKSSLATLSEGKGFSDHQRLFASCSSDMHPYIRWHFASHLAREAVKTVENKTFLLIVGMLQAAGYLAPLTDFFVNIFYSPDARNNRGICAEVVLSHMLSFENDLISRSIPESLVAAMKQRVDASLASESKNNQQCADSAEVENFKKIITEGVLDDVQFPSKAAEGKLKGVGKELAKACCNSARSAACAAKTALLCFSESFGNDEADRVDEHIQVMLFAELMSQLSLHSSDLVFAVASSLIKFCGDYAASLPDFTKEGDGKMSPGAIAISSLLLRFVSEGLVLFRHAVQELVLDETTSTRAFWMLHLMGVPAKHLSVWVTLSLSAAQYSMPPGSVLDMLVLIAGTVSTDDTGRKERCWSSDSLLSSLGSNEPIRTAIMLACNAAGEVCTTIDQALLNLVKISCLKHKITTSPHERIAYTILKEMNNCSMSGNEDSSLDRRTCDVLSSLKIDTLSIQVAELKFLYVLMGVEAEGALLRQHQRIVAGAREQALFQVNDDLSNIVLEASSRNPSTDVLIAEIVLFLGEQLAGATLQRLSRSESGCKYDNRGIITLTFLTRARGLQRHGGQTVIASAIGQLAAAANQMNSQLREDMVWKQLRLLVPMFGFILSNKEYRVELSAHLLQLLSLSSNSCELENVLIALSHIVVSGFAPSWHTFARHQRNVQTLQAPSLVGLRPALQARLGAGFGNPLPEIVAFSQTGGPTDPWALSSDSAGEKTVAAHWLVGTVRTARSATLLLR